MKKLLLTVAVSSLATTAHARPVELPDAMLGRWCSINDSLVYTRSKSVKKTDCVKVQQERFSWHDWDCKIDKTVKTGRDTYLVHARCEADIKRPADDEFGPDDYGPSESSGVAYQFKLICKKTCNLSIKPQCGRPPYSGNCSR